MAEANAPKDAPGGPWQHEFVTTPSGTRIHYVTEGPKDALPIVFVHGWPDIWFGWRRQIKALSPKYRVIAPDLRGFGQSSTPTDVESFGSKNITSDLAALLDALEIEKAVFIGHDWGGSMVWRMALYHPTRVLAVAAFCTPYLPPSQTYIDLDALAQIIPAFEYQKFMADTTHAQEILGSSPRRFFTAMYRRFFERRNGPLIDTLRGVKGSTEPEYTNKSELLSDEEIDYYVQQYTLAGFQSSANFYACRKIDFETERSLPSTILAPSLYVGANNDIILKPEMAAGMPEFIPDLEMKFVDKAGHWILWEQSEEVNAILTEWLAKINAQYGPGAKSSEHP